MNQSYLQHKTLCLIIYFFRERTVERCWVLRHRYYVIFHSLSKNRVKDDRLAMAEDSMKNRQPKKMFDGMKNSRFSSFFSYRIQNPRHVKKLSQILSHLFPLFLVWNLKNDKSSIPRLLVIRIQFWKKVVVELFCFRPKIYLSISTSWVGSSRNRDSFFSVNFEPWFLEPLILKVDIEK